MLVSFIKNSDGVRNYPYKGAFNDVIEWARHNIRYEVVFPKEHWNRRIEYLNVYSNEDCSALLLKFGNILEPACWGEIAPFDDEEVKIHCHRCNGYVFSVSGHEWKTQPRLHTYKCTVKDGKCEYE